LITDTLMHKYKYKLKGVGPIGYHLGGNSACDQDGTLRYGPQKYIDKLIDACTALHVDPSKQYTLPLEKGDHPETDDSPELDAADIKVYLSMMGALKWCVLLGRFDIMAAVMTMSCYCIALRVGHLNQLKQVYGYLRKFKHGAIRSCTGMPDYNELEEV
jgi:hypothetical protein